MKVKLAEHFYSIQGEGKTAGYPAVFIRLSGCNLLCGGSGTQLDGKLHNGATWRCDTIESWMHGKDYELSDLVSELTSAYNFKNTQVVITGGEPFMQPKVLQALIESLEVSSGIDIRSRTEIETNGTISPSEEKFFIENPIQYNCSPKLSNSGMSKKIRYQLDIIKEFNSLERTSFKFVVASETDCEELLNDFLPHINPNKVFLMPASDTRANYIANSLMTVDLCKKYGFKFSPRHHLMIWDKKTGV